MRVLIVEDEKRMAGFIGRSLRSQGYEVEFAENGEQALALAGNGDGGYDAIVLDLRLPGVDGLEVCRRLRAGGLDAPVLMVTARTLVEQRVEGLDAGADDYLTKPFDLSELHARLRALIRRGLPGRGAVLRYGELELDRHRRRALRGPTELGLTPKEFSLLECLMLHAPAVVRRSEIVEYVWSRGFDSETNLVEVYVNRLRQKIGGDDDACRIQTVRGVGYQLSGGAEPPRG
ncbi:MAG TPA: response regulator transcription factor [Terriglobales bacterium]|nr:response regulator transcription factor [Terriglobales bacterium]